MTSQSSEFILIVDDNPANLAVLSQTLKGAGHAVRVAVDGQSALEQIALELPTLILLDVMMPGIDGFGACRQLKENPATMEVPVIFMTALADSEHKVHGLSIGAADYITKPFNEAEVLARINVHLKLRKLLNTLSDQNRQLQQEIEKRQQAEAELQGLNEDLEQRVVARTKELQETHVKLVQQEKLSTLGELMTGVAHEINNPMGCIASNIQFVRDYTTQLMEHIELYQQQAPEASNDIHNHAENIDLEYIAEDLPNLIRSMQTSSDRIRAISNSLRIFARRDTQHKSEFNLHEGLDSTLLILKHRLKAQEKRDAIEVLKNYGNLPDVLCYPGQINQVFMNILANAIDAFDARCAEDSTELKAEETADCDCKTQGVLQIHITTAMKDGQVIIRIQDNAGGMPESVRSHIFERAYTTKAVGKGTGLGLSIAHQIIVATHGGQLDCWADLGKGTEFLIELPVA